MANKTTITPEIVRQLLSYDPESGRLFWRQRELSWFAGGAASAETYCRRWNAAFAGKEAFVATGPDGYRRGCILDVKLLAHRVIWALHSGDWPRDGIDHKDGDRANNRIANLREATARENAQNMKKSKRNTSGYTGVVWSQKAQKWVAQIMLDRKAYFVGHFDCAADAATARGAAKARLHQFQPFLRSAGV